ncbi:MAG: hypothetical protein HY453_01105 [Parcubacteria group bacterium]|nr:hypothetical protein [Parcubacteria group bacterium]
MFQQKGAAALLTTIFITLVVIGLALAIHSAGINELLFGLGDDQAQKALLLADTCADEARFRIKKDASYAGGTIPIGSYTCTVSIAGGGSTKTITASATVNDYTQTVVTVTDIKSNVAGNTKGIDVTSWSE